MERERPLFEEEEISERAKRNLVILETLRRRGPLSRTEISRVSGINPVTVSNYIDKLISQNIVYEKEYDISSGGRRPMLLGINPQAAFSIGIGINLFNSVGLVMNLEGKVIYKYRREKPAVSPNELLEVINSLVEEILSHTKNFRDKIKGIGIGVGGIIDQKKGIIRWPQFDEERVFYSYVSMPLKRYLEEKFGIPVFIDNDANLACFAEQRFSLGPEVKNVIYMFSGVGCGIIINREVYTGQDGCAGELFINVDKKESSCLGDYNFFKQWPYDLGLIEKTNNFLKGKNSRERVKDLEDVFSIKGRYREVEELVREAARALGIKIAFLVNLLNPQVVVIGGGFEKGGFDFIEKIYYFVRKYAFEEMTKNLKIVPSLLGEEAVALGAANLVVRSIFTYI